MLMKKEMVLMTDGSRAQPGPKTKKAAKARPVNRPLFSLPPRERRMRPRRAAH